MPLTLYNTLTRRKEVFAPIDPNRVTMYVCGPTVYGYTHVGNARPAVVFDVLFRLLKQRYPLIVYARNITDVDDKINAAAKQDGVPIESITSKYAEIWHEDMDAMNVLRPTIEPRATRHIPQMLRMIEDLIARGHAYAAEGHVLFHVPSFARYGELSGRNREDMIAGARVEVAPYKKDPADFVLWKPSTPDLPGWDSPWGRGRPGWHIECSAMIAAHLGETIDIHAGGHDLIFPHHENELAQSTCSHDGARFVGTWMHNGFLTMSREKMSKSLGNIVSTREALRSTPGEALRWAILSAHYRQPLDWSDDTTAQAKRTLDRFYGALDQARDVKDSDEEPPPAFLAALEDDLNTPAAMAEVSGLVRALNSATDAAERARLKGQILAAGELLGVLQQDPAAWFAASPKARLVDVAEVERLIEARTRARKARDFAAADHLRASLDALGVVIEDRADGVKWRMKE
jgi:cysteinyl-tRNA synthetase